MKSLYRLGLLYVLLLGMIALWLGCGSTVETPTQPTDENADDLTNLEAPSTPTLQVDVRTDKAGPFSPGEAVEITASVDAVRGSSLNFDWINVTGYGTLSTDHSNSIVWTAPTDIESGQVKVEVIQLVVTVISQLISVDESGVQTDTQILTETRTMPLTTVGG